MSAEPDVAPGRDLENAEPERVGPVTRWLRGVRDGTIPGGPL